MTIRRFQQQRLIAWMALVAILLLSIVPTVSQLVAASPHADHARAGTAHALGAEHFGHELAGTHGKGNDDDCWRKCAYCDFLVHVPALGTFVYVPAFAPTRAPAPVEHAFERPRALIHLGAAQPRGPPAFLA